MLESLWNSIWQFLQKLEIDLSQDPAISFLGIYPKDIPSYHEDTCLTMFITGLFIITKHGNKLDVSQLKNGQRNCGTFTLWNITQQLKMTV